MRTTNLREIVTTYVRHREQTFHYPDPQLVIEEAISAADLIFGRETKPNMGAVIDAVHTVIRKHDVKLLLSMNPSLEDASHDQR